MGLDPQTEVTGFVDRGQQLFRSEFLRMGIAAVSQHGSAGKNFDVIDTVVGELTNYFSHFPRTIGFAVVQVPWKLNVGSKASERAGSAGNGDVGAGNEHARADDIAAIDGVTKSNVAEGAISSHIADGGESGLEHSAGVGHRLEHDLRSSLFELTHGLAVMCAIGDVSVAIDKAGQNGHLAEVDDGGVGGDRDSLPETFNLRIADEDDLVGENRARVGIDEAPGADRRNLSGRESRQSEDCGGE